MRILVTGGAGFIGSHVLQALEKRGYTTAMFDSFEPFYDPAIKRKNASLTNAKIYEETIEDKLAVDKVIGDFNPDAIIHLAARAGVRPSLENPRAYVDTNIIGTLNILEVMRTRGIRKLLFASSSSVYGANTKLPFSEADPLAGSISPYAATKIAGEHLCSTYADVYGLNVAALRFFTVYGPRQRPDLAIHKFTRQIFEGKSIPQFGDGSTRRDYTYIDDIVQGVLAALDYEKEGFDVFNLGESRTTTLKALIELIEGALGKKAEIDLRPPQPGDVDVTYADVSKARELLNYRPEVQIEKGITSFVQWFLEERGAVAA